MPKEADKFNMMNNKLLTHYIYHASQCSHDWLDKKQNDKDVAVEHFTTVIKGGVLHLDDGRGDIQWKGIENWEYSDTDPNTEIPFKKKFEKEQKFIDFREHEIKTLEDKILSEKDRRTNYADIQEIKNRIDKGRIIICKDEDEVNKLAKEGDRKIKNKLVMAVIRK